MLSSLILAFVIAILLSWIVVALLGWRRHNEPAGTGMRGSAVFFFLIVFVTTWVGSMYLQPMGPVVAGVAWLGPLLIGFFVAMILAAAVPPGRPPVEDLPSGDPNVIGKAVTFSAFFWILAIGLMILLFMAL